VYLRGSKEPIMARTNRYVSRTAIDTYANSTSSSTPMPLASGFAMATSGDIINVLNDGTDYVLTANLTTLNAGTASSPIIFRGYKNVINDGYLGRSGGRLITTNMPRINTGAFAVNINGTHTIVDSFDVWSTGRAASILSLAGTEQILFNAKVNNGTSNSAAEAFSGGGTRNAYVTCDFIATGSICNRAASLGLSAAHDIFIDAPNALKQMTFHNGPTFLSHHIHLPRG